MKSRHHGIDFLKFIAALMITNSHFIPLYKEHNISFATFGVHGNAIFFFVSGFFLINLSDKNGNVSSYIDWIRKKIIRLWPPLIVFFVLANLIFSKPIDWYDFLFAGDYWFVRCFVVSFSVIYFIIRYLNAYLKHVLIASVLLSMLVIVISPKALGSIYHEFHYTCYFSSMMLGVYIGINKQSIKTNTLALDIILSLLSFVLYFGVMHLGKGKNDFRYYLQILALFPLLSFLFYTYKTVSYDFFNRLAKTKIWHAVFFISSLTYEIYIVQFDVITDAFNKFFPLNTFIVFSMILVSAYILRVITNVFIKLFSKEKIDFKNLFIVK